MAVIRGTTVNYTISHIEHMDLDYMIHTQRAKIYTLTNKLCNILYYAGEQEVKSLIVECKKVVDGQENYD